MPAVAQGRLASSGRFATLLGIVLAAAAFSWVAFLNRAPLVFPDTIAYANAALKGEVPGVFSVFYSYMILPFHQGRSLWPVVMVQCLLMAHLLYLTARCVLQRLGLLEYALLTGALCVFSGLPWITGQVMPDVFAAVLVLGVYLLVFCRRRLHAAERVYVALLTAAAITTHLSYIPIAAGLIALSLVIRLAMKRDLRELVRAATLLGLILTAAAGAMLAVNWLKSSELRFARNSNVFLLAKLLDEGSAVAHLAKACPAKPYRLCAYLAELKGMTHDELKWSWDSPFWKFGSFDALEPEAAEIVAATIRDHPGDVVLHALGGAAVQLLKFSTGEGLTPQTIDLVAPEIGTVFAPGVERSLRASRQATGTLPIAQFNLLHLVTSVLSLIVIAFALALRRRQLPERLAAFLVFVIAALLCNAVITGGLSGPYDRYLARIIFLASFAAGIVMLHFFRSSRASEHRSQGRIPASAVSHGSN